MLKILWKRKQFLLLSRIFCYLILDFCDKDQIFSSRLAVIRDNQFEITRVDCINLNENLELICIQVKSC